MSKSKSNQVKTIAKDVLQTYTASKPPKVPVTVHSPRPVTPGGHGMVPSVADRYLQRTAHALQCIVNGDDATVFPVLSLVTLTFDLDIQTCQNEGPNTSSR